ncbi:hypothetical protein [Devosia sp. FJ2-5-3]|uniref:hypothetical protein n=1 Tax=Devosia sp. FJ2-5-3 TaxID=2976680 RepID=UPI0023D7D5C7|nr:hypothetical protein [Devosia sp. FJ2-5-3]WEJ60202.1 hypothetical protein N0P34_09270 [Devosia sp. FJ2-5-3]
MRPVSQTGLHRIPHNPHQRVAGEGGAKRSGTKLEAYNDSLEGRSLHPTKGYRNVSIRRSRAALLMADIKMGTRIGLRGMGRFVREGF